MQGQPQLPQLDAVHPGAFRNLSLQHHGVQVLERRGFDVELGRLDRR